MAYKICPRCHKLIPQGVAYCEACRPIAEAQTEAYRAENAAKKARQYNRRRDPKYLTFYRSKDWRTLSRVYLQTKEYRCEAKLEGCTELAVEVHHRKAIQTDAGWDLRLDWDNLEALCVNCHNKRHERFTKATPDDGVIDLRTVER